MGGDASGRDTGRVAAQAGGRGPDAPQQLGLSFAAVSSLLLLCLIWGGNFIAIMISNRGFQPIFAASMRSAGSVILLLVWGLIIRHDLRVSGRALLHCFIVSLFFAGEFFFVYWGTKYTLASRATVLLYTSPFWVTLGAHFLLGERLTASRITGLLLAFGGVAAVFGAGFGAGGGSLLGDSMELVAAVFWAGNTLYGKRALSRYAVSPTQLLFYQVLFSAPLLFLGSLAVEGTPVVVFRLDAVLALVHQTLIVVTITYLAWFWLLRKYKAGSLVAFSFFTPLFGVLMGGIILGEPLPWLLWLGATFVAAGIYLVNRR